METSNEYINSSQPWRESDHIKQLLTISVRFYIKDIIQKVHVFHMLFKDSNKKEHFKQRPGEKGSTQLSELRLGEFSIRSR